MNEQPLFQSMSLLLVRLLVGGIILVAGLLKYKTGVNWFWQQILEYKLVKGRSSRLLAYSLPTAEILCGIFLMLGYLTPIVVVIVFSLLGVFTIALLSTFWRGRPVDCGCFGHRITPKTQQARWTIAYRNLGLMVLLLLIYLFGSGSLSLDSWLHPNTTPNLLMIFWLILIWSLLLITVVGLKRMIQKRNHQSLSQPI